MSFSNQLWRLFAVDTLDTRFSSSAKEPVSDTARKTANGAATSSSKSAQSSSEKRDSRRSVAQPSRWNTLEYYFYYLVFIAVVPWMFIVPYDVSKGVNVYLSILLRDMCSHELIASDPQYHKFEPLLSPGWIPGRKVVWI